MNYSDLTFNDKNPIKGWLHRRRLVVAIRLANKMPKPQVILDFGSGDGEMCKHIVKYYPSAKIICYEPAPEFMLQAKENLAHLKQIIYCTDINDIELHSIDLLFCLEVLEHLPPKETDVALNQIDSLLSKNGSAIVGVPVEVGLPALYKGIFRMYRRYGYFDAKPKLVFLSTFGFPPKERPIMDIASGFPYYRQHMGYDFRKLRSLLQKRFNLKCVSRLWINPEAYFIIKKL